MMPKGINRTMRRSGFLATLLLVFAVPSLAQAKSSVLDPSFGSGGRVVRETKLEFPVSVDPYAGRSGLHSAQFLGGRIGVISINELFGFGLNGRTSGNSGPVEVPKRGGELLYDTALASDGSGHVLVAGQVGPDSEGPYPHLGTPVEAQIARFDANGELDRSFGQDGVIVTDLGLPAPLVTGVTSIGTKPPPGGFLGSRQLQISGIAVDTAGRIVITGTRTVNWVECRHGVGLLTEAFVARLDPAGNLDSTFGLNGVVSLHLGDLTPFNTIGQPVLDPNGGIYIHPGRPSSVCAEYVAFPAYVAHLNSDGSLDQGFGLNGLVKLPAPFRGGIKIASDRSGGLLVLAHRNDGLMRLRSDGTVDAQFGDAGLAVPFPNQKGTLREIELTDLEADASGHVWLAGTRWVAGQRSGSIVRAGFLLARLNPSGQPDTSFGRRGSAVTWFGARAQAAVADLLIDKAGRPLLVGTVHSPSLKPGTAMALARYRATP